MAEGLEETFCFYTNYFPPAPPPRLARALGLFLFRDCATPFPSHLPRPRRVLGSCKASSHHCVALRRRLRSQRRQWRSRTTLPRAGSSSERRAAFGLALSHLFQRLFPKIRLKKCSLGQPKGKVNAEQGRGKAATLVTVFLSSSLRRPVCVEQIWTHSQNVRLTLSAPLVYRSLRPLQSPLVY